MKEDELKSLAPKCLRWMLPTLLAASSSITLADDLPRRLDFGWSLRPPVERGQGALLRAIAKDGPAAQSDLKVGDEVVAVQGLPVDSRASLAKLRWIGTPGAPISIDRRRDGKIERVSIAPGMAKEEAHPGIAVEYRHVTVAGPLQLRTLWSRPTGVHEPLPGILVVGWLSCASIEAPASSVDTTDRLVAEIVRNTGATVVRVDKPGAGDSEGVCSEASFALELEGYRRALAQMKSDPHVDGSRIAIVGLSSGGGIAPLVDPTGMAKAFVSIGGWSKTWFEHMLDLERRRLELTGQGTAPGQVSEAFKKLSAFHAAFLLDRWKPSEVMARRPELAGVWYEPGDLVYGRSASYFHELQALDLAQAWSQVRVPTLVVWGEFDWIMSRSDQELIVRLVNGNCGECARLLVVPRMDHAMGLHGSSKNAFDRMGNGDYADRPVAEVVAFLRAALRSGGQ